MNQRQHKHQLQREDSSSSSPRKKIMFNQNQPGCDIYDVVAGSGCVATTVWPRTLQYSSISSAYESLPFNFSEAMSLRGPFTAAQWQELERQSAIFNYMVASVPVPPDLLLPISTTNSSSVSPRPKVGRGSIELGFSGHSDQEPWRCRRTDGKKWRCSRDVVPDQKYCERHTHKGRPRSRKPVELHSDFTDKIISNNATCLNLKPYAVVNQMESEEDRLCSYPSAGYDQPRYLDWNSPPGGPLAEALCLGISSSAKVAPTSSPHSTTTSTSKSFSGDGGRGERSFFF